MVNADRRQHGIRPFVPGAGFAAVLPAKQHGDRHQQQSHTDDKQQ
jgi:hypothetical protein